MSQQLSLVFALACLCAVALSQHPPFPVIPTEFTSSVRVTVHSSTGTVLQLQGHQNYSLSNELSRYDLYWAPPASPQWPLHTVAYESDKKSFYDTNQVCRQWPGQFATLFAFVPESQYLGQQVIDGRTCDEWYITYGIPKVFTSYLTLFSQGNQPVRWNSTFFTPSLSSMTVIDYGTDFRPTTFTPNQVNRLSAPKNCYGDGFLCPGPSKVTNISVIRIHPSDNYNLTNKNTADISGDAFFICSILTSDAHNYDTLISVFEVQINSSFGRYGKCNGGHCIGSNDFSVGRAATYGVKPFGGQCANNSDTGTWYSMSGGAECLNDAPIGTNMCAWKTLARKKTIDLNCAASLGMRDACIEFPSIPVPGASDLLVQALETCPDIPPGSPRPIVPLVSHKKSPFVSELAMQDPIELFAEAQALNSRALSAISNRNRVRVH